MALYMFLIFLLIDVVGGFLLLIIFDPNPCLHQETEIKSENKTWTGRILFHVIIQIFPALNTTLLMFQRLVVITRQIALTDRSSPTRLPLYFDLSG